MHRYPNITQKIILRYKNKAMILRHKSGNYDFPGGQLEWREDLFGSLQRELQEELAFKLKHHPRLFHVWNYVSGDGERHSVMVYYIYELQVMKNLKSPEGMEVLWLTKNEMKKVVRDEDYVERIFKWSDKKKLHSLFYCD